MSKVYLEDSTLTAIGNAIRTKAGSSNLIRPGEMASAITNLPTGGSSEIKWKMATITPASGAIKVDVSPWITDANINDWFMYGSFGYWAMSDISSTLAGTQVIGPILKDLTPTHGTKTDNWGQARLYQNTNQPHNSETVGKAQFSWNTWRPFTWDATAKTLTWSNTNFLGKNQIILIYREV